MNKKFSLKSTIIVILFLAIIVESFIIGYSSQQNKTTEYKTDVFMHAETIDEINELKYNDKPVIVVFGADYCPTCINYKPYIKEIADLYSDDVIVKYVDTVDCEAIRDDYNIEFIPSTIIFDKFGMPYKPAKDLDVVRSDEEINDNEREYISSEYTIAKVGQFDYSDQFEYGVDKNNNHGYTKFVGLLDMLQLEEIIIDLIED